MKKRDNGFTLIEMTVVLSIIAILSAFVIPSISNSLDRNDYAKDKTIIRNMNNALEADELINGKPTNVRTVISILEFANLDNDGWTCNSSDCIMYWFKEDNKMLLYNSKADKIEYPLEYQNFFEEESLYDLFGYIK